MSRYSDRYYIYIRLHEVFEKRFSMGMFENFTFNGYTKDQLMFGFGRYLTRVLVERVQYSVDKQMVNGRRMKQVYKPLSMSYVKTKPKETRDKFWINTGKLISQLRTWKYKNHFFLGYPRSAVDSRGTPLHLIIKWVEEGTDRMPARPLFYPMLRVVNNNLMMYFNHYLVLVSSGKLLIR